MTLRWISLLILVWVTPGCATFVPLGTLPPEDPDYQPPLEARVVLRYTSLERLGLHTSDRNLRGTIEQWDEDRLAMMIEDCESTNPADCQLQFRIADVQSVEAREPFPAEYTTVIVLGAIALGLVAYGAYWFFQGGPWGLMGDWEFEPVK